jgi:hypothetical protein
MGARWQRLREERQRDAAAAALAAAFRATHPRVDGEAILRELAEGIDQLTAARAQRDRVSEEKERDALRRAGRSSFGEFGEAPQLIAASIHRGRGPVYVR